MKCTDGRGGMSRQERAKQFMPFAALKGYEDALRKKEKVTVPKAQLCPERQEELDRILRQIRRNDMVTAVYFMGMKHSIPASSRMALALISRRKVALMANHCRGAGEVLSCIVVSIIVRANLTKYLCLL